MRGKPVGSYQQGRVIGLIPAHAGKTERNLAIKRDSKAHPRACGENVSGCVSASSVWGSSPRMRGKLGASGPVIFPPRLIPAHAGKTESLDDRGKRREAHPRACGENFPATVNNGRPDGSSPRMRGKRSSSWINLEVNGLIPAHAGKTFPALMASFKVGAHPRACGENLLILQGKRSYQGSSPRMRGKLFVKLVHIVRLGLIPAHAGKTPILKNLPKPVRAHPRACGENTSSVSGIATFAGSSPRMRGKRGLVLCW